jgi:hypothetical protein
LTSKGSKKITPRPSKPRQPDYFTFGLPEKHLADPPWHKVCAEEWVDSLKKAEKATAGENFWEGERAAKELDKLGHLASLMDAEVERTRKTLRLVFREVEIYRYLRKRSVEINREFHEAEGLLTATLRKLRNFSSKHSSPAATTHIVGPLANEAQKALQRLPTEREQYWEECLDFTPRERLQPRINRKALEHGNEREIYLLPDWAVELECAVFNWKIPRDMTKRANLDTRLQMRLAAAFRLYLPDVSWRTIARLVVLTYICTQLVRTENGEIILPDGGGEVTVMKVEKKIYKAMPAPDANPDAFFQA